MAITCDYGGGGGGQQFHPPAGLIGFRANVIWIAFERYVFRQSELVVSDAGTLADDARLLRRTDFDVLIGKATLECVKDMATCPGELVQPMHFGVSCSIEGRNDDQLVRREIGGGWIDEIGFGIHAVERVVKRPQNIVVSVL